MSVAELQTLRTDRAAEQAAHYDFRLATFNGLAVVYVISRVEDRNGNYPIYTVNAEGRCNCGDFVHRCSKIEGLKCKHGLMVEAWLADCDTPEGAPAETLDAENCHGCGFPRDGEACGLCGSSLIQVAPTAVPSAETARRSRYDADVAAGLWG